MADPDIEVELEQLRAELERVRAENHRLQAAQSEPRQSADQRSHRRGRRASLVLTVIAGLLLPLGLLTLAVRSQLLNTDRYVETVTPLASDSALKASVVNRITKVIVDEADFEDLAMDVLPARAQILAGPIASGAEGLVRTAATKFVDSEQFRTLWVEANRAGHESAVKILTGKETTTTDAFASTDGKVVVRMGPLVRVVLKTLDSRFSLGLEDKVPAERINFAYVLVDSPDLAKLQGQIRLFNKLSWLTAILAIASLAGAVLVAEDRRLGVRRAGFALAGSMFALLLGYEAGRAMYLGNLPEGVQSPTAAAAVFDIITRFTHQAMKTMFVIGLVLVIAAWLVGPSRSAVRVRGWWGVLVGRVGESGAELGPVPAWASAHEGAIRVGVVSAAALMVVLWNRPTGRVILAIALAALVLIGLVQLLAAPARRALAQPSAEV